MESIEVKHFKGIEYAHIQAMGDQSFVALSGRNGTGKSLILEAIAMVSNDRFDFGQAVGPWAKSLTKHLTLKPTSSEIKAANEWADELPHLSPIDECETTN